MRKKLKPKTELRKFADKLRRRERFVFIRFSDGELEIINGHALRLNSNGVLWSRGVSDFAYPQYDHKDFDPIRDVKLREAVVSSAKHRAGNYFKGIPTRHNRDSAATKQMVSLNSGGTDGLTFADLWINSNFNLFIREVLPLLRAMPVTLIANYRANPGMISKDWSFIPIPDGAFQVHETVVSDVLDRLAKLPAGSVVLCSASSLTNIIGLEVSQRGLDITLIDIGTAIHHMLGLEDPKRLYLSQLKPWSMRTAKEKLGYCLSRGSAIRW